MFGIRKEYSLYLKKKFQLQQNFNNNMINEYKTQLKWERGKKKDLNKKCKKQTSSKVYLDHLIVR